MSVLQLAIKHSDVWTMGGDWSVRRESAFCHLVMFLCAKFNENLQKQRIVKQIKMTPTLIQGFLASTIENKQKLTSLIGLKSKNRGKKPQEVLAKPDIVKPTFFFLFAKKGQSRKKWSVFIFEYA